MGVVYQEKVISKGKIADLFCYAFMCLSLFSFLARSLIKDIL